MSGYEQIKRLSRETDINIPNPLVLARQADRGKGPS